MRVLGLVLMILATPLAAPAEIRVPASQAEIGISFSPVVKQAAPSVVNIYAERVVNQQISPFANDPFFSQFMGFRRSVPRVQNSLGSGVIVSDDGYVVSNHHVVGDARDIRVVLNDGREYQAEIVLQDAEADLAIMRIENAPELPAIALGDSDAIEVGDLVLAIGNPFGVGQTVSSGIVSALARSGAMGEGQYFIQTDAPINPGNSGGALVDMAGRLIGVNTAILTRSGGSNGIGFAIPARLVETYLDQARAGASAPVKPWLGARVQPVDSSLALALGLDRPQGVMIAELHPDSPLALAGAQVGDVIMSLDGHPIGGLAELSFRMNTARMGVESHGTLLTPSGPREVSLTWGPAPDDPATPPLRLKGPGIFEGLELAHITPKIIDDLGLPIFSEGVVVRDVSGPATRIGLRPGDVLRSVNGLPVNSPDDFAEVLRGRPPGIAVEFIRDGRRFSIRLRG